MQGIDLSRRGAVVRAVGTAIGSFAVLAQSPAGAHGEAVHKKSDPALRKEQKPWGVEGDSGKVSRTVSVRMLDYMRFSPDRLAFKLGETVRLHIDNDDLELHEFVMGTKSEIEAHAAQMKKFPNMEHDEPWMVHVTAGGRGEIVWHFNRRGNFVFACLLPRHYEAGMVGHVSVT